MPIHSMTGFGRASFGDESCLYSIEVKSVNHRHLDVRVRLPKGLSAAEPFIRQRLSSCLSRGRIEVSVSSAGGAEGPVGQIGVDLTLAQSVVEAHRALSESCGVPLAVDSRVLANWPGVLSMTESPMSTDEQVHFVEPGLNDALDDLLRMRASEGSRLEVVLRGLLTNLDTLRQDLAEAASGQSDRYAERLERRIRELLQRVEHDVDDGRILHEVGVFAERTDITEELERLRCHVEQALELISSPPSDGVGRKLDFLCQELLREVNTVGSKAQAMKLTETVVDMKGELEKLREQIQNVE